MNKRKIIPGSRTFFNLIIKELIKGSLCCKSFVSSFSLFFVLVFLFLFKLYFKRNICLFVEHGMLQDILLLSFLLLYNICRFCLSCIIFVDKRKVFTRTCNLIYNWKVFHLFWSWMEKTTTTTTTTTTTKTRKTEKENQEKLIKKNLKFIVW